MLKAEIENIGIPNKGVPQGGILSPLLANVVLNEFDWWISNQWQTYETKHKYHHISDKYYQLRKSKLKEIHLIRYADDFLIFCKDKITANKIYYAVIDWLKHRLDLNINKDFSKISYNLSCFIRQRLKMICSNHGNKTMEYIRRYSHYRGKEIYIHNCIVYPIYGVTTKPPMLFNKNLTNYTPQGRELLHKKIGFIDKETLKYFTTHPVMGKSIEYNDNRLSLYSGQKGICPISKYVLNETSQIHHIIPISQGGTDEYKNLIMINQYIHRLIHLKNAQIISNYLEFLSINHKTLNNINKYRNNIGNTIIE